MRALITGSQGFVGKYLRQELLDNGYEVVGLDRNAGVNILQADMLNFEQLQAAIETAKPDVVFHLAAQTDVAKSWQEPKLTFEVNVCGAINLLEAVRSVNPKIKLLMVGSSDEYGSLKENGENVTEDIILKPQNPYALSKKTQEELAAIYGFVYGLDIYLSRSFNHSGAGQCPGSMIPDFAYGIVKVENGLAEKLLVGNLTAQRDFTHVKDVVRAYRLIVERGRRGEIYNVGSGITYSAQEILDKLCAMSTCSIAIEQDVSKMRPSDTQVVCCNNSKLIEHTGWYMKYTIDDILEEILAYFRQH